MKRVFGVCVVALLVTSLLLPSPALAREPSAEVSSVRIRAVVVGVSDFAHLEDDADLRFGAADAQLFLDTLLATTGGAVKERDVTLLLGSSATQLAIEQALLQVFRESDDNDVVVLFFATHGVVLGPDEGYLMAWDSEPGPALRATGISARQLNLRMQETRARHVLLFTDASHGAIVGASGGKAAPVNAINGVLAAVITSHPSLYNFAAAGVMQRSQESESFCGGHGAFTCALVRGMEGEADRDGDGQVRLGELSATLPGLVQSMVREDLGVDQVPEFKGNFDSQLVLSVGVEIEAPVAQAVVFRSADSWDGVPYLGFGFASYLGGHEVALARSRDGSELTEYRLKVLIPLQFGALWAVDDAWSLGAALEVAPLLRGHLLYSTSSVDVASMRGWVGVSAMARVRSPWGYSSLILGAALPGRLTGRVAVAFDGQEFRLTPELRLGMNLATPEAGALSKRPRAELGLEVVWTSGFAPLLGRVR